MSTRQTGEIAISIRGERSKPVRLRVSLTSRSDMHRQVEKAVEKWARGSRKWWGVFVDSTKLDNDGPGEIYINDDHSVAVASFRVVRTESDVPEPISALFAAGGTR